MSLDSSKNNKIDKLLADLDQGRDGAIDELIAAIYPELKRLAHFQLVSERPGHTLNTTAIVHEAYLRLAGEERSWNDRAHFMRAAATVMRHLLVDHARRRNAAKRGDGKAVLEFDDNKIAIADDSVAVLVLDSAMKDMAAVDPRLEKIIECRFFAGLSVSETANVLGVAVRTVERDWQRARGYVLRAMELNKD